MTSQDVQQIIDEADLDDRACWAGWRAGERAFQPGVPLRLLPLRARERARTFAGRLWPDCTPRLRVCLMVAYAESYTDGALEAAWRWAWDQGDQAFAQEVRAYYLERDR